MRLPRILVSIVSTLLLLLVPTLSQAEPSLDETEQFIERIVSEHTRKESDIDRNAFKIASFQNNEVFMTIKSIFYKGIMRDHFPDSSDFMYMPYQDADRIEITNKSDWYPTVILHCKRNKKLCVLSETRNTATKATKAETFKYPTDHLQITL